MTQTLLDVFSSACARRLPSLPHIPASAATGPIICTLAFHSFPVGAYVLFSREQPGGIVLVVRPMVPVIAALVAAIHVFVDPRDKPAGDG